MSDLRDARFQRALEAAPDAAAQPGDVARRAIRNAAHAAIAPCGGRSWLRRWWAGAGRRSRPWNAAFASVLLASLVTVLWYDREIPDATPQMGSMDAPATTPSTSVASPAPAPVPAAEPAPKAAARGRLAIPAPTPLPEEAPRREVVPEPLLERPAPPPLAKTAPAQTDELRRSDIANERSAAPAFAPPPPMAGAAPTAAARMQAAPAWTHLRIEIEGRQSDVPREQATRLAELLRAMDGLPRTADPLPGAVVARVEILSAGELQTVLELAPPRVRFSGQRGVAPTTVQPDPTQLQALQAELTRLTGR